MTSHNSAATVYDDGCRCVSAPAMCFHNDPHAECVPERDYLRLLDAYGWLVLAVAALAMLAFLGWAS